MITEEVLYQDRDGTALRGYLARAESAEHAPGIIVVGDVFGLSDVPKKRARMLSELGFVALVADVYGNGTVAAGVPEAMALKQKLESVPGLIRSRMEAALARLTADPRCNPKRIGAIGYCFGGTCVLELARSGADLACAVSFHGGLETRTPALAGQVKASLLVCTGAEDPIVPPAQIQAFQSEMRAAGADWQVIIYSGAGHAFTIPEYARFNIPGVTYNRAADERSWLAMRQVFDESFGAIRS